MGATVKRKCCCSVCPNCATDVESYTVTFIDVQICSGCFRTVGGTSLLMTTTTINKSFCLTRTGRTSISDACIWGYTENPNVTFSGTYYSASGSCGGAGVPVAPKFSIFMSRAIGGQAILQWLGSVTTGDFSGGPNPSYRIWNQTVPASSSPCWPTDWTNPDSACTSAPVAFGSPNYYVQLGYGGTVVITPNC